MIWRHVSLYFPNSPSSSLRSEPARQNLALVFLRSANNRTHVCLASRFYTPRSLSRLVVFLCFCVWLMMLPLLGTGLLPLFYTASRVTYRSIDARGDTHRFIYVQICRKTKSHSTCGCIPFQPNVVRRNVFKCDVQCREYVCECVCANAVTSCE